MSPPIAAIVARVQRMHPNDTRGQRRALTRWAGILRANDPFVAEALLSVRFIGSANDTRASTGPGTVVAA